MSHTVTVTRTTTTTTTSAIIINTGYLKTWPGILKLAQLLLGIAAVGTTGYYFDKYTHYVATPEVLFLLIAVTFMIGTFLLLTACLLSISTASIISKTLYEVVYHGFAFLLVLIASLVFIIKVNDKSRQSRYSSDYNGYLAASIIGLVNSVLYFISTFLAMRTYRGH